MDELEKDAMRKIFKYENVQEDTFSNFVNRYIERQVYNKGIDEISYCSKLIAGALIEIN